MAKYANFFLPLEGNLLKVYRNHSECNSNMRFDAIYITLHRINSYFTNIKSDTKKFENECINRFVNAILQTYDQFSNPQIKYIIANNDIRKIDLSDINELEEYFSIPVKCIIRIIQSIETFNEMMGFNGYFILIEAQIGKIVSFDEKMDFAIPIKKN